MAFFGSCGHHEGLICCMVCRGEERAGKHAVSVSCSQPAIPNSAPFFPHIKCVCGSECVGPCVWVRLCVRGSVCACVVVCVGGGVLFSIRTACLLLNLRPAVMCP